MTTHSKCRPFGAGRTSRRAALSLVSAMFASSVLSACDAGTTTPETEAAFALQLSASLVQMSAGDTMRISVVESTAGQRVTWTSDDPWIAAVDDQGLVAARTGGETTIKVSSARGQSTARVRVGGTTRPVTVTPDQANLPSPGAKAKLDVTVRNNGGNVIDDPAVEWSSLNPGIVTVDDEGIVVARTPGTARIVAAFKSDADTATVVVGDLLAQIASITLSPASTTVIAGDSLLLVATARDANGAPVPGVTFDWSSSSSSLVTVNGSGVVRAIGAGSATVRATAAGGKSGSASITVLASQSTQPSIASVAVSPEKPIVYVGEGLQLFATVKDDRGSTVSGASVTWRSSNTNMATVDGFGKVLAKAAGIVMITAASGGKVDTATVTVQQSTTLPAPTSSNPEPKAGDRVLWDTRAGGTQDIQTRGMTAEIADGFLDSSSGGAGFAVNFDGKGKNAYRYTYKGQYGACVDISSNAGVNMPSPLPTEMYVTWKMWMGRTAADAGGIGESGYFDVTSDACTGDAAGRKIMRFLRDVPDRGASWSFDMLWSGPTPGASPFIGYWKHDGVSDGRRTLGYNPETLYNQEVVHTIYMKAASSNDKADGVLKVWLNGKLMGEWHDIAAGTMGVHRVKWPMVVRGPVRDMSEYWWDIVMWEPQSR